MSYTLKIPNALWMMPKFMALYFLWGCIPTAYIGSNQIPFTSIDKIPLVEGKLNGKCAFFIIDTGASCSILNASVSEHFGFYSGKLNEQMVGLGGDANLNHAYQCVVEFGTLKVNALFRSRQLDALARVIRENENVELAGIIGSDIFKQYKMTIDYKSNTISF